MIYLEEAVLRIIGDIHGKWAGYATIIANCDCTIQVGDFGLGYYGFPKFMLKTPGIHRFIRGNHDEPEVCKKHPWYLGDYGYLGQFGDYNDGIFYIGGAWTPDFFPKRDGINWWRDEELEYMPLQKAIYACAAAQPKIIITHDCPRELKANHLGRNRYADKDDNRDGNRDGNRYEHTRTDNALQILFEMYQPDLWFFGHYHERFDKRLNGTQFICLEEFGVYDVE
jgi:hypothetical protein